MKILLLSRYDRLGASSRVRSLQYLSFLESRGWEVDVCPLFSDRYLQALYSAQPRWSQVIFGYLGRVRVLLRPKNYDLFWIEKELFPFMPAFVEYLFAKTSVPYVVDYDDALFHRYDKHRSRFIQSVFGRKIDIVMRHAASVVVGNEYLAERARDAGARRVEIIPTVVDLTRYQVVAPASHPQLVVGWIGSPSTSHYLLTLENVFVSLVNKFDVRFVAVGSSEEQLQGLPIETWHWSEKSEVQAIQSFDIGIMPLTDSPWERGKCGYKLIQYMACGVPVVASPVGVNGQIVDHGVNGFLAQELHEWEQALGRLLNDQELRRRMGSKGRERVESWYSLQVQAPRLEDLLLRVLR